MYPIRSFLLRLEEGWFLPKRLLCFGFVFVSLAMAPDGWARLGPQYQMALGNPDGASTNSASRTKFLINQRAQYAISYNDDTHQPNWVSWSYSLADDGTQARTDYWQTEELLPSGYLKIGTTSFGSTIINGVTNSWDRGHMTPSADRTKDLTNNQVTFRMSNIIPQASRNNQGLWNTFEDYCRGLAADGDEVLIITGPAQFTGSTLTVNPMAIAGSVWKIVVEIPNANSSTPANQRITTASRVIAILTPNVNSGLGTWQSYITTVEEIEAVTGFNFFTNVDPATAIYLKNVQDTGTGSDNPTVITTFSPTLGAEGSSVVISGYNFNASSTVQFNGVEASVTFNNQNQVTAIVPAGATTGLITVTGSGGSDTSYEPFTVTTGPATPTISVSPISLSGLTANEGLPSVAQNYAVNGSNLTGSVAVTAPINFEVSTNGTTFTDSLSLVPAANGSLSAQVSVRINSTAPVGAVFGSINHASTGATSRTISVSGSVISSAPQIALSTTNLTGFTALQGGTGGSKTYTVSGVNLTNNLTVTAPAYYELSLSGGSFTTGLSLTPTNGTVANTTIYARLSASATLGTVTGFIEHAGGGATAQNLSVSGTVTTPGSGTPVRIAAWDFTGESNSVSSVADIFDSGLDATNALTRGPGALANTAGNSFRSTGFQNNGISTTNTDYFQFAFSAAPGAVLSVHSIIARFAGTSTFYASPGVSNQLAYSTNGSNFVLIGSPTFVTSVNNPVTFDVSGVSEIQNLPDNVTVTFRFYASGQTATGGWGFNSPSAGSYGLDVSGILSGTPLPAPFITVSGAATASALEAFSYQISANNSPTSYAASGLPAGLSLNTTTGLISGTPTTPGTYTIALTASNAAGDGTAMLTLNVQTNPNAPAITSNLITYGQISSAFSYQILASNTPNSFTAANLPAGLAINTATGLISGTPGTGGTFNATITAFNDFGNDSKTLQIIVRVPTLTLTPAGLNPFTADAGVVSDPQSYTLGGSDLFYGPVTVRAPQYFEISTDGVNFVGETTLTPNGSLSQVITVRVANTAPPGPISGVISHTGSGAAPKYMEMGATVAAAIPTLALSTTGLAAFSTVAGTASTVQTYEVSGASLNGPITITPPPGFEITYSTNPFSTNAIQLTPANKTVTATAIDVRLSSTAVAGTYSGSIAHTSAGAATADVAVTGTVTTPVGPNIIAASGGSTYVSNSYSYTISTDGLQTVTSYGATGLPTGLSINSSNGVISGAPTVAGFYNVTLRAIGTQGTSAKPYTLRVIAPAEQPSTPTVVINKYQNATIDRIELLVIGDTLNGPPVDLRGMTIKDFNGSMATDGGGKYMFADHPLWTNVKAGTLIVLTAGNTETEDTNPSDFTLAVNLGNLTYFAQESSNFDIANTDMIMIKPAGMQPDGVAGGMHVLAAGTAGATYNNFTGRKIRVSNPLLSNRTFAYVINDSARLLDFYLSGGADYANGLTFGTGNNPKNRSYITSLRNLDQTPPTVTLNGNGVVNLTVGGSYLEMGASVSGGTSSSATITGSVNTSLAGTYFVTYTATDSAGNIGTATRTVNVLAPASTPPTVTSTNATTISTVTATLSGNVVAEGSSGVTARGFLLSLVDPAPQRGAASVTEVTAGSGSGSFNVQASGLAPGSLYRFRAFAVNASGTSYGETLTFTTLKGEPVQHPSDFSLGTISSTNIPVAWTAGEADGYLLVVSDSAQNTPLDGVPVADDHNVSDGSGAVNLGAGVGSYSSFVGFAANRNYTFRLYPFNNSGTVIDYKTAQAPVLSASLLTTPQLFISGSLAARNTSYGTPSGSTSFTVSGEYLTSTVNIAAPAGFEISTNNLNFSSSLTLSPEAGTMAGMGIYLRLAASANVGGNFDAQNITVSGGGAATVTLATATGNGVSPKPITVGGLMAENKVYDGTTNASVVGMPSYEGLVNNESFAVTNNIMWAFPGKNAGTNQSLVASGEFTPPSPNYAMAAQPTLSANISAKPLSVSGASVKTKVYDGNAAATITGATLVGVVEGDSVTVSGSGNFNDANAGENKPVTASLNLGGSGAGNYSLVQPELTGTISKASQIISFVLATNTVNAGTTNMVSATAGPGMTVAFASANTNVAIISNQSVVALAPGVTTITASQAGDANFEAARPVSQTLKVAAVVIEPSAFTGTYSFASGAGDTNSISYNGTFITNLTISALTKVGVTSSTSTGNARATGFGTGSTDAGPVGGTMDANKYFQFTLSAAAGFTLSNPAIDFGVGRSGTGPRQFVWRSSVDNYASAIPVTTNNILLTKTAGNVLQTPDANSGYTGNRVALATGGKPEISFRLYIYGSESLTGTGGLQGNLTFSGTLVPAVSGGPAITPSGTFEGLTKIYGASLGSSGPVLVSGGSLTSNITASVPDPFQVSADGVTWAGTTIFTNEGGFASGNLFLRLKSNASVGNYTGQSVSLVSGGASNRTVAISSSTVNPLAITVTDASVQSKTYDGNTSANLLGGTLVGKLEGDDVGLAANPVGTFASPEVGTWQVETRFVLNGATKSNYYLNQPTNLTGTITAGSTLGGWSSSYGLTGSNAVADADPDGDGWKNSEEYAFGLNPTNQGGSLAALQQTNHEVKLTFLKKETGGINYIVKSATNLSGGLTNSITPQPSADTNGVPAGYKRYEATMSTTNERGFIKVEATIP